MTVAHPQFVAITKKHPPKDGRRLNTPAKPRVVDITALEQAAADRATKDFWGDQRQPRVNE